MTDWGPPLSLFSSIDPAVGGGTFDAERLTQARYAAGLSKAKLAEQIGVTPAAIGQYESRQMSPRPDVLASLSDVLDVPVDFFTLTVGRPLTRVDGMKAHFRSLRSTTTRDRQKALAFIEQVWELANALERRVRLPDLALPLDLDTSSPAAAAQDLRARWGFGAKPIKHLVAQLETRGLIVSILSLASADVARVGAFSTSHLPRPVVVITPERAMSVYVHRFTVAHELGHLILHRDAAPGDPQQEREADQFAAELLTPRAQITNMLPRTVNLPKLAAISQHWGVSVDSLLIRMKETGTVSEVSVRRGYQRLNQLRAAGGDPAEPVSNFPGEMPSMLRQAATLADESGYSITHLARELRWKPARVREVLGVVDARPQLRILPPVG